MPSLRKLMGGALFATLSGNYQMGDDPVLGGLAHPRVLSFNGSGSVTLPSFYNVPEDGRKFFLVNQTGGSVNVFYNTFPVDPITHIQSLVPVLLGTLSAGNVGTVALHLDPTGNFQKWALVQRAYGGVHSVVYKRADGASRVPLAAAAAPPVAKDVPPPFFGTAPDFSACNTTYSVALSGGTGDLAFWNGTWTVTKSASASPYYWRHVIDANHWVDLRGYPSTLYEFNWQVVLIDLKLKIRRRFGTNAPTYTCPAPGLYLEFAVPAEQAFTTGSILTCNVT